MSRLRDLLTPQTGSGIVHAAQMRTDTDVEVIRAIEASLAQGRRVLLHIMDSSKLRWRAPSATCLDKIVGTADADDEEFMQRSIFPFTLLRHNKPVSISETSTVHLALARLVTDAWSVDGAQAQRNVQHILDRIANVLVKIELLLDRTAAVPA